MFFRNCCKLSTTPKSLRVSKTSHGVYETQMPVWRTAFSVLSLMLIFKHKLEN